MRTLSLFLMFSMIFKTFVPNSESAFLLLAFLSGGLAAGWLIRKLFFRLSRVLEIPSGGNALSLGKLIAGTLSETFARTSLFLCVGLAFVGYGKYSVDYETLAPETAGTLARLLWIFICCAFTVFLWNLVKLPLALIRRYATPGNKSTATLLPLLSALLKIGILALAALLIIRIATDTQPTEILAMLGIGGLAIGLASQDTVKNFFGSVMLILDSPFRVGDTIDIGDDLAGTVEEVGVRSTRIRSRDGSVLCIPNGDLANRTIRTVTARETIRDEIVLGLSYSTTPEQIENGVNILRRLLDDPRCILNGGSAPRIYFSDFRDSSIDIKVVYHFASSDYAAFLRFKHELNLSILREFNRSGLEFAFPTQTVYLKNAGK